MFHPPPSQSSESSTRGEKADADEQARASPGLQQQRRQAAVAIDEESGSESDDSYFGRLALLSSGQLQSDISDSDDESFAPPSASDSSDEDGHYSDVPTDYEPDLDSFTGGFLYFYDRMPRADRAALREDLGNLQGGPIDPATFDKLPELLQAADAYRNDVANWDVEVGRERGMWGIVGDIPMREAKVEEMKTLDEYFGGEDIRRVRQYPGGGEEIICEHFIKVINAAAGGFVLLASAAARTAFFEIFEHLGPFFKSGGKMLMLVPVGELKNNVRLNFAVWQSVLGKLSEQEDGGLRCAFTNNDQLNNAHVREGFAICPGGKLVEMNFTCDFTASAVGIEVLRAWDPAARRAARQSLEKATFQLYDLNSDDEAAAGRAREVIDEASDFWRKQARLGRLVWNSPVLDELNAFIAAASKPMMVESARRRIISEAMRELNGNSVHQAALAAKKASMDVVIAVAASKQTETVDDADEEESEDPDLHNLVSAAADACAPQQRTKRGRESSESSKTSLSGASSADESSSSSSSGDSNDDSDHTTDDGSDEPAPKRRKVTAASHRRSPSPVPLPVPSSAHPSSRRARSPSSSHDSSRRSSSKAVLAAVEARFEQLFARMAALEATVAAGGGVKREEA
ncbi:hypothetical protein JCM10207_005442 [Rhodosporidiobolus poonsookiae]